MYDFMLENFSYVLGQMAARGCHPVNQMHCPEMPEINSAINRMVDVNGRTA